MRFFLLSYRRVCASVAAVIVIVAVIILFPTGEKQRKTDKPTMKENIIEEVKRSLSERPPGMQDLIISEETKRSLSERPQGFIPATITPEILQSLNVRSNH